MPRGFARWSPDRAERRGPALAVRPARSRSHGPHASSALLTFANDFSARIGAREALAPALRSASNRIGAVSLAISMASTRDVPPAPADEGHHGRAGTFEELPPIASAPLSLLSRKRRATQMSQVRHTACPERTFVTFAARVDAGKSLIRSLFRNLY